MNMNSSRVRTALQRASAAPVRCHSVRLPCRVRATRPGPPQGIETADTQCMNRRTLAAAMPIAALAMLLNTRRVAAAEEEVDPIVAPVSTPAESSSKTVYLSVTAGSKSLGTIVVELFDDVPIAAARFADLVEEKEGVGYRLSKFDGIFDDYIRNEGVKRLAYNASERSPIAGGDSTDQIEEELSAQTRRHDQAGLVSLVVGEAKERKIKEKLIAYRGQLITIREQVGEAPNGTAFAITTGPSAELDATNLIVGRVVAGMDVVAAISNLPVNRPQYDSPFFQAGKLIGDKRADVAERAFNRPLVRVFVARSGLGEPARG